jgi:hypothetical protein
MEVCREDTFDSANRLQPARRDRVYFRLYRHAPTVPKPGAHWSQRQGGGVTAGCRLTHSSHWWVPCRRNTCTG